MIGSAPPPRDRTDGVLPEPPRRWKTRLFVPLVIFVSVAGLLVYAARAAWRPSVDVWVIPVVAKPHAPGDPAAPSSAPAADSASGEARVLAQAPGWIEPDPYAISVPALADGVIREVLVLEGQHVERDQVVARMVDEDAKLELARAEAELAARRAELLRAQAESDAAAARAAEVRDKLKRETSLLGPGGAAEGPVERLKLQLAALEKGIDAAHAAVDLAEATVHTYEAICEQARLRLRRMEIRSPATGVVMARLVEPGTRIAMAAGTLSTMIGAVIRLYEPSKLQVRVDVPIADAAKVGVGTPATITTDALPDTTLHGDVSRLVHEANIQRNTVQVKVAIRDPSPTLKPEMLTRVRFLARTSSITTPGGESGGGPLRILAPRAALVDLADGRARAWVVEHRGDANGPVAALREVKTTGPQDQEFVDVLDGLQPGDRLIVDPPQGLRPGEGVHILGEKTPRAPQEQGL